MTNETHFDLDAEIRQYVLRQKRTTIANKNLQEIKSQNKSKFLYMVGDISYYTRTSLIFYSDETKIILDIVIKDVRFTKLKRESSDTHDQYETHLAKWNAKETKIMDIKVRDSVITQYYYTRKILPYYLQELDNI